ncbi:hypothetical protein D3C77_733250 [compost metagenome]
MDRADRSGWVDLGLDVVAGLRHHQLLAKKHGIDKGTGILAWRDGYSAAHNCVCEYLAQLSVLYYYFAGWTAVRIP